MSSDHAAPPRDLLVANAPRRAVPRAYGWFTRIIRPLLILSILGVIAIIFFGPMTDDTIIPSPSTESEPAQASNDLVAPKFSSVDENGHPFTLTAARAVQVSGKPDLIDLDTPTGTITLSPTMTLTANAPSGLYDQNTSTLDLSGGVVVTTTDGYRLTVDHIQAHVKTKELIADAPVHLTGPMGEITAQSAIANAESGTLILTGPATLILTEGGF